MNLSNPFDPEPVGSEDTCGRPDAWGFDWTRRAATPVASAVVSDAVADIITTANSGRARKPQERHYRALATSVEATIANGALQALRTPDRSIYVSRSKKHLDQASRYRPTGMTGAFPKRLDELEELGWISQDKARSYRDMSCRRSTVTAGPVLVDRVRDLKLSPADFRQEPSTELLRLKGEKAGRGEAPLIEYAETGETRRLRAELQEINAGLGALVITAIGPLAAELDLQQRQLHRSFLNGRFDHGGRFWGGFWLPMGKAERFEALRIDGERLVELDFGQLHPRIAYTLVGVSAPPEDLYDIPGLEGVERQHRKSFLNAALWSDGERKSLLKGTREFFPQHLTGTKVMDLIAQRHPPLGALFRRSVGARIMGIESEVMNRTLLRLTREGVPALPIHDALLTPLSAESDARRAMEEEYRNVTDGEPVVGRSEGPLAE